MPQKMMWIQTDATYRGQASDGTIVTVDEAAMMVALKRAGKGVYDSDWWIETLRTVLQHWGISIRSWIDDGTQMGRLHFYMGNAPAEQPAEQTRTSGPLSTRLLGKNKE